MLPKLLAASRYLIIIAVVGSLLAATLVMLFGVFDIVRILIAILQQGVDAADITKKVAVGAIELIELFLLGTVLYVIALGLYQLFINKEIELPAWLKITTLDNLKERLLATVLVMLAVSFFGYAVTWDGSWNIIAIGLAIGVVIVGVAYTLAHAIHDKEQES
ncbi:MAG: YqhA family protein [Chloroflexota bacterium]|nr:MAG: YqhA family protein [Chloroflexota bacterium]